jgi:prevent-host-death family protein
MARARREPPGTAAPSGGVLQAAEFKANALAVMRRVHGSGEAVVVTSHGRPLVRILPMRDGGEPAGFGCMREACELLASEDVAFPPRAAAAPGNRKP